MMQPEFLQVKGSLSLNTKAQAPSHLRYVAEVNIKGSRSVLESPTVTQPDFTQVRSVLRSMRNESASVTVFEKLVIHGLQEIS